MTSERGTKPAARWRDWLARHVGLEVGDRFEVYRTVAASATLRDATYWMEILFSAGIATLGLVLGSPAVIIGAMLISPLMSPIMALGLALAAGDFVLAFRSTIAILLSSLLAIGFSTLLVALLPFREMTSEIAARTHPNTLDLVIALLSGAVGALAVCKSLRGLATSLPGVAIAVALMPPLCVTGYGVGVLLTLDRAQGLEIVRGGSLLFLTNLVAITFSSMLLFLAVHVDAEPVRERIRAWREADPRSASYQRIADRVIPAVLRKAGGLPGRIALIAALVATVFVPLKNSFDSLASEIRERQKLNATQKAATSVWTELFARTSRGEPRSYIDSLDAEELDGVVAIRARAFVSSSITTAERAIFEQRVAEILRRKPEEVHLSLVEIPTSRYQVAHRVETEAPAAVVVPVGARLQAVVREAATLVERTALPGGARIVDVAWIAARERAAARVAYLSATPISADAVELLTTAIRRDVGLPGLAVTFEFVPAQVSVAFEPRGEALDAESGTAVDRSAAAARQYALRCEVTMAPGERFAERQESVRRRLIAAGLTEQAVTVREASEVPADRAVLTLSK